jgi:hypothetical protein
MNPVDPETDMRKLLWANFWNFDEQSHKIGLFAAVIQRHTRRFLTTPDQIMNQDTWTIVGLVVTNVFLFLLVMGM